jgi:hypothetical protein
LLYSQEVKYEDAKKIKDNYNFDLFFETSEKDGLNIDKLCYQMVKILYDNFTTKKLINKVCHIYYFTYKYRMLTMNY